MRLPEFRQAAQELIDLMELKNQDYATDADPFYNFNIAEIILRQFKKDRDKVFVWPIITKLSRLAVLLNSGKGPNNESVSDSLRDVAVYVLLWKCDIEINGR